MSLKGRAFGPDGDGTAFKHLDRRFSFTLLIRGLSLLQWSRQRGKGCFFDGTRLAGSFLWPSALPSSRAVTAGW